MKEIPQEIILRCQNGSAQAFAELVDRYEKPLFAYVYRMNCTAPDLEPEDITQDIFLKVYKNMNNFKQLQGACFSAWLFTIARNHCIGLMRKNKNDKRNKALEDKAMSYLNDRQYANPQKTASEKELAANVATAVTTLPEQFRSALILRYYQDMSYSGIAQTMQCNEGTAKSRVARAKQMLSKLLDKIHQPG